MAVDATQLCTIEECLPLLVNTLGIGDSNYPDGSVVASGAPYTVIELADRLYQADYEMALMITDELDHPYREIYVTQETDPIPDGEFIPAHLGLHSRVMITYGSPSTTVLGRQRDFHRIKLIKANPAIYGSPNDLYNISGGRLHLSNPTATATLDIPNVIKGTDTMITPVLYQWGVIASAVLKCGRVGFPDAHRRYWASIMQMYMQMITEGAASLPEPEQIERLET